MVTVDILLRARICDSLAVFALSNPDLPRIARTAAAHHIIFPSPAGPIPSYSFYRSPPLVGSILWLHSASRHFTGAQIPP
jgi:hypothetical protein